MKEGSEVVARCTVKGTEKTADDLGKIGKDGMKVTKGTITEVDTGTKTVVVKSADGTEKTVEYTGNAKDMGCMFQPTSWARSPADLTHWPWRPGPAVE